MPLSISSSDRAQPARPAAALQTLLAAVLIATLAIAGATEWLVRTQVLPQDTLAQHKTLLATADSPDAAFGDSHVARGFDAKDGFVNLAYPSENIEAIYAKVQTYYADKTPGRVILQADPHLFAPYRLNAGVKQNQPDTKPFLYSTTDRHRPRLAGYWAAFFRGGGVLTSKVTQTPSGALLSKGNFAALPARRQTYDARHRLAIHGVGQGAAVTAAQARYTDLVQSLTDRGADICLVSFPVTTAYLAAVQTAGAKAGHATALEFFSDTATQQGARYVDARAMVSDTALFRDVDHLNVAGAKGFADPLIDACFGSSS